MKKPVNTPQARPHSPYGSQYFHLSQRVMITNNTDMCTGAAEAKAIWLLYVVEAAWKVCAEENKHQKNDLRERGYFCSVRNFADLEHIMHSGHRGIVTLSRSHVWGNYMNGYNLHWMKTLHIDPNTTGVYLVCVCDCSSAMHAICVDARKSEPAIYDCAELYSMKLTV